MAFLSLTYGPFPQAFWVCHNKQQDGFLCPNGTLFNQRYFTCDWWFNVDCNTALQLYVTNEALSLLPAPPEKTFPEDFNGPIVDWYIYQRHQERAYRKVSVTGAPRPGPRATDWEL